MVFLQGTMQEDKGTSNADRVGKAAIGGQNDYWSNRPSRLALFSMLSSFLVFGMLAAGHTNILLVIATSLS